MEKKIAWPKHLIIFLVGAEEDVSMILWLYAQMSLSGEGISGTSVVHLSFLLHRKSSFPTDSQ